VNTYVRGQAVRLTGTFRDITGTLANPTTVTLTVARPDGTNPATAPLTSVSTGVYAFDLTLDAEGTWAYRWAGTGAVVAATEGAMYVRTDF
jgi:VCBS repeat-containing protein